ncbi:peptide synthetase [Geothrix limicola]|uniref:Peptide synthetase n=1 Tax=Geothrix limicola TaxID=2927978 RepID=A0ABQ5QFC1_9BACT|nr:peptide synthetase [Geothrix limicola]
MLSGRLDISDLRAERSLTPGSSLWISRHVQRLFEALTQSPETPCEDLSMLDSEERALLLGAFSGPAHDPGLTRAETLPRIFEETARLRPDLAALEVDGRTQTYAELEAEAERIGRQLQALGLGRGSLVGHWFPRGGGAHAALLGILKAGAAYVPLDPDLPPARLRQVVVECRMDLLLTPRSQGASLDLPCPRLDQAVDVEEARVTLLPVDPSPDGPSPDDLAYVIFTSGSTGTPKGVPITHRSACTLVRAEQRLFAVTPGDRVFQGFSLAFDASVEELWLAWANGACLVVGTKALMQSGPDLGRRLGELGITVWSTVPTLLGLLNDPVPTLRLLILGGEACPPDLVARWWRPDLRMVNTYGPTEATVISTWTDLHPDRPVSIGKAVPNDRVYVLDARGRLCPIGVPGELHLSGVGLSQGYLGRPELTAERFIPNPYADGPFTERLYRTGDRVRFNDDGDLEFLGRIDTQVKLRGFRIELEEIEASLRLDPAVQAAAVTLWKEAGPERLVAYAVPSPGASFDEEGLLRGLRERLPSYMVPSAVEALDSLPTLASGKLDRKRLPAPRHREPIAAPAEDLTPCQQRLRATWTRLFSGRAPGLDENFFKDLGGHSLLAAAMVSELRREPDFEGLAVSDVYAFPTLRALAAECEARISHRSAAPALAQEPAPKAAPWRFRACALAQALSLYPLLGFYALQWLSPYLVYSWSQDHDFSRRTGMLAALASLILVYPAMYGLSILAKWALLGRMRPGRHPIWGFYYWRWWLVQRIVAATPLDYLVESPWLPLYYRLMGARMGRNVHLGTTSLAAFDLVEIGDDASIGQDARLSGYTLEDGFLQIGPIHIGRRCYVGNRSILCPGTVLEDGAMLEDLSLLPAGARIASGQHWTGSPAQPLPPTDSDQQRLSVDLPRPAPLRRMGYAAAQALGAFLIPVAFLAAIFPGLILINELYANTSGYFAYLVVAPAVGLSFVVLLALEIAAAKWLLLGRVRPGTYDRQGPFILRKWFVDRLMSLGLDLLAPLYATLYLAPWFRLLGARLGAWAEVSTAGSGCPDLLDIGEESFIADCVSFGPPRVDLGRVTLAPTRVGRRAFVGNSALIPSGTTLGESVLVGVMSVPPVDPLEAARVDSSWLGSPAIYLPRRQESSAFGEETTFRPPRRMILLRAFIEQFRVIAPVTGFVVITSLLLTAMTEIEEAFSLKVAALSLPALYFLGGLLACFFVVAVKWLVIGFYRPSEKPLWCSFVWRTELVSGLHENLADSWLLRLLVGTPFVPIYFRLLGSHIGRRVCMESTWLTEFDLVRIGDGAQLNADCTVQTHLFEDRVMKMDRIEIGPGCSLGTDSVVLYGSRMEAGSVLGDLSLLMKGESLPAGTRWEGSPARPSSRPTPPAPALPAAREGAGGGIHVFIQSDTQPHALPAELADQVILLNPDPQGRPRAMDGEGRPLTISRSRALGVQVLALAEGGRLGVDLERLRPSEALQAASKAFLPAERDWADRQPEPRWKALLRLWTAKEAILKALGHGFATGLDQVELGPDGRGGLKLLRLFGREALAEGWHLECREHEVEGRTYLLALARATPSVASTGS